MARILNYDGVTKEITVGLPGNAPLTDSPVVESIPQRGNLNLTFMSDLKDAAYSRLKQNLDTMGAGVEKHKEDKEHPLPSFMVKQRYTDQAAKLEKAWSDAQDALTKANEFFDAYQLMLKESDALHSKDARTVKGVFGIYHEELRDFGIKPEKKRPGVKIGKNGENEQK